jgi:uncharacterized protein
MYEHISQFSRGLRQLSHCLDKAVAYAATRKFDVNVLASARLAPDQFDLARQVQIACDTAKLAAGLLSGKEVPTHADTEKTIDELKARIASTLGILEGFKESDFTGSADRIISRPRWEGKVMKGSDYLREHAVPNFFFHVVTAYALLRHNGVDVGKSDYLGQLTMHAR